MSFRDDFEGERLDTDVWLPHYLPQWSSRADSAATYAVADSELRLTIPPDQPLWCPEDHSPPLRVSGVQSGVFSGPVGSTVGQQPFRDGQTVREEQRTQWGWTPEYGRIEVCARMDLSPRSMASVWMVGREERPEESGEICLFEVFGEAPRAVGMGVHPFRDPALADEFEAPELQIDVSDAHVYAAEWQPERIEWFIGGEHVRTARQAPGYPLQMMVAVFDFPEKPGPSDHLPLLAVDYVQGPEQRAGN